MKTDCDCILLDIEGTTTSISFVYDEMFPYVRSQLATFLEQKWNSELLNESVELIAEDAQLPDWPDQTLDAASQRQQVASEVIRQMDNDLKATGLKNLQGKIWKSGFDSGALKAHLFDDVKPAIEEWKEQGKEIRIYSSGSVEAQLLFFGHTIHGDLLSLFSGHYDTKIGGKKETLSYEKIAGDSNLSPDRILFISDIVAELDAAKAAGYKTALSRRPGNGEVDSDHPHQVISSFAEIALSAG